jgi:hypothetical protein
MSIPSIPSRRTRDGYPQIHGGTPCCGKREYVAAMLTHVPVGRVIVRSVPGHLDFRRFCWDCCLLKYLMRTIHAWLGRQRFQGRTGSPSILPTSPPRRPGSPRFFACPTGHPLGPPKAVGSPGLSISSVYFSNSLSTSIQRACLGFSSCSQLGGRGFGRLIPTSRSWTNARDLIPSSILREILIGDDVSEGQGSSLTTPSRIPRESFQIYPDGRQEG